MVLEESMADRRRHPNPGNRMALLVSMFMVLAGLGLFFQFVNYRFANVANTMEKQRRSSMFRIRGRVPMWTKEEWEQIQLKRAIVLPDVKNKRINKEPEDGQGMDADPVKAPYSDFDANSEDLKQKRYDPRQFGKRRGKKRTQTKHHYTGDEEEEVSVKPDNVLDPEVVKVSNKYDSEGHNSIHTTKVKRRKSRKNLEVSSNEDRLQNEDKDIPEKNSEPSNSDVLKTSESSVRNNVVFESTKGSRTRERRLRNQVRQDATEEKNVEKVTVSLSVTRIPGIASDNDLPDVAPKPAKKRNISRASVVEGDQVKSIEGQTKEKAERLVETTDSHPVKDKVSNNRSVELPSTIKERTPRTKPKQKGISDDGSVDRDAVTKEAVASQDDLESKTSEFKKGSKDEDYDSKVPSKRKSRGKKQTKPKVLDEDVDLKISSTPKPLIDPPPRGKKEKDSGDFVNDP